MGPAGRVAPGLVPGIDGLVENVWWHDGRSPAYGDGISFWALGEMIRGRARLQEDSDEPTTRAACQFGTSGPAVSASAGDSGSD
jgi:hypothetical protein